MTNATSRRTFVGVALDPATRDLLGAHLDAHLPDNVPGKFVTPANWHITLRFLGSTSETQIDQVAHYLSEGVEQSAFSIRFGRLGAFPRASRAAVLWVGVERGIHRLTRVAEAAEEAVVAAGFGPEDRPFHPHLTIARIRPPEHVGKLIEAVPPFTVEMRVAEVTLFESHLGGGPATYEPLERIEL